MVNEVKTAIPAYRIGNSGGDGSYAEIVGLQLSGRFAFDIWYKETEQSGCLVCQKDGFSVGVSGNAVLVRTPSGKQIWIKNNEQTIPGGVWKNLYLGYDGKEITAFLDGYLFGTAACPEALLTGGNILIGTEFTGYVRTVRFYSEPIPEEKFKNYLLAVKYNAGTMPGTAAFMDFSRENITDLSGNGVRARVVNNCAPVDTVEVYRPAAGNFAHFADPSAIDPGGYDSGEFSVYAKLYLRPVSHARHIIAINGALGDSESVAIFADCADGSTSFTVMLGGKEYAFASDLKTFSWADLIVCLKGTTLTVYMNGEKKTVSLSAGFKRTLPGDLKIGGCVGGGNMTCEHYIHTVAVFDRALSDQDAADFLENHPFVFEDGLTALVDFSAGSADELVSGTQVYVDADDLLTAENTVGTVPEKPYQYRINYSGAASDMKKWEGETTALGIQSFLTQVFVPAAAISAAGLTALTLFLARRPAVLENTAGLYVGKTVTEEGFAKSISGLGKSVAKVCVRSFDLSSAGAVTLDSVAGMAAISAILEKMKSLFLATLAGAGALALAAAAAATIVQQTRREKPDDDDDKDAQVALSAIALKTAPDDYASSAIWCRDHAGVIQGDEWTSGDKCKNPAVYIADRLKRAKIRVKFQLRGEDAADTHTVSLSASVCKGTTKLFDNFSWEGSGLVTGKDYEAELTSGISAAMARDFACEQIELWWSAKVDGRDVVLPNTKLEIYTIPTVPCPPIFLDGKDESTLVAVEYLKIATSMLARKASDTALSPAANLEAVSTGTLRELAEALYSSNCFKYVAGAGLEYVVSEPVYSNHTLAGMTIKFNRTKFLDDVGSRKVGGAPIEIECSVYASILCTLFRLMGLQCELKIIVNHQNGETGKLHTVRVYSAGNRGAQEFSFKYHVVVSVPPQSGIAERLDEAVIYDAAIGIEQNGQVKPLSGLPFRKCLTACVNRALEAGSYRGQIFMDGSVAVFFPDSCAFQPLDVWPYPQP